ncbi:MAG TPA: hypothetical protein VGR62_00735 [Candidatus Binatia bacterium]|jgi:hypothetical protein|nr:hypothetical protein [Candidatus Binatia bacterium]
MNALAAILRLVIGLPQWAAAAWRRRAARGHPSPFVGNDQARRHADSRKQFWAELHAGERLAQQRSEPSE